MEKVMESHGILNISKSMNPVIAYTCNHWPCYRFEAFMKPENLSLMRVNSQ